MPPFRTETSRGVEIVPVFPDGHELEVPLSAGSRARSSVARAAGRLRKKVAGYWV